MEIYDKLNSLGYDREHITIDDNVKQRKDTKSLMDELFPSNQIYDIPDNIYNINDDYNLKQSFNCYRKRSGGTKNNITEPIESSIDSNDFGFNNIDCNVINYGKFKSTINPNVVNDKNLLSQLLMMLMKPLSQ